MAVKRCRRGCCIWYYAGRNHQRKVWKCAYCPNHTNKAPRGALSHGE